MAHDGKSLFFAESWACRVHRYWFDGPKAGTAECVIRDMPGYPDNINRASDGTYWMAWLGMRTPSFDLALRHPGLRKRMTRRLPQDEWLFPNINTGGVVKFDETGRIVETLGDMTGVSHPMVTSMREHKGYLYVGGILNNRIGRYKIPGADPNWTGPASYWGARRMIFDPILDLFRGKAVTIPPMDGALQPNTALDEADGRASQRRRPTISCARGQASCSPVGNELLARRRRRAGVLPTLRRAGHARSPPRPTARWRSALGATAASTVGDGGAAQPGGFACPTALAFDGADALFVCNGSARHRAVGLGRAT